MRLYLVQHGQAMAKEDNPDRPLTQEGMREVGMVGNVLEPLGIRLGAIWHSGKKRAEETAVAFAGYFTPAGGVAARDGLDPDDKPARIAKELRAINKDLMIVGHLPFLSRLVSLLLTGKDGLVVVHFHNAGVACLERGQDGQWQLEWYFTPELVPDRPR